MLRSARYRNPFGASVGLAIALSLVASVSATPAAAGRPAPSTAPKPAAPAAKAKPKPTPPPAAKVKPKPTPPPAAKVKPKPKPKPKPKTPPGPVLDGVRRVSVARSEFVDDYLNTDGTHTAVLGLEPRNVKDARGAFVPIVRAVRANRAGELVTGAHPLSPKFAKRASADKTVSFAPGRNPVSFGLIGSRAVPVTKLGSAGVRYAGVLDGVDLDYRVTNDAVKEELVIRKRPAAAAPAKRGAAKAAPAQLSWQFVYIAPGLKASKSRDGSIFFKNKRGVVVASVPPGEAWDSNVANRSVVPVSYSLGKRGRTTVLTVSVDRAWATSAKRTYPLHVDPTFTHVNTSSISYYRRNNITATEITDTGCLSCGIRVGNDLDGDNKTWRTAAKFPYEQLYGTTIQGVSIAFELERTLSAELTTQLPLTVHEAKEDGSYQGYEPNVLASQTDLRRFTVVTNPNLTAKIRDWVDIRDTGRRLFFIGTETPGDHTYNELTATMTVTYAPSTRFATPVYPKDGAFDVPESGPTFRIAYPNPTLTQQYEFVVYTPEKVLWRAWTNKTEATVGVNLPSTRGLRWRVNLWDGFTKGVPGHSATSPVRNEGPEWVFSTVPGHDPAKEFVYVALGDSYSSGEGAGNSELDTQKYKNVYETGYNYEQPHAPRSTYQRTVDIDGDGIADNEADGCHRARNNYAKLNRGLLQPAAENVVLIDATCSGAQISMSDDYKPDEYEPGDMLAIVGNYRPDSKWDHRSQVDLAIQALAAKGLTPAAVDLVTVSMGGNDAGFGNIVLACGLPMLIRETFYQHPGNPQGVTDYLPDCKKVDNDVAPIPADVAIDGLRLKVSFAQRALLNAFGRARIMQLTYPDILPSTSQSPEGFCGGIYYEDLDYAKGKIEKINKIILEEGAKTRSDNYRFETVNVEGAFGKNPICTNKPDSHLANGMAYKPYAQEIRRLLNMDNRADGDPEARRLVDVVMDKVGNYRDCVINFYFCKDPEQKRRFATMMEAVDALTAHLDDAKTKLKIAANTIATPVPGAEPEGLRFDRSRGYFHPNEDGYDVLACHVRAKYFRQKLKCKADSKGEIQDTAGGQPLRNEPLAVGDASVPDGKLTVSVGGFAAGSEVDIVMRSKTVELGTVVADADGVINTTVELPPVHVVGAGAHTVEFRGVALGDVAIGKQARVTYPGRPVGQADYATYLSGFDIPANYDGTGPEDENDPEPAEGYTSTVIGPDGQVVPEGYAVDSSADTAPVSTEPAEVPREEIDVIYNGEFLYSTTPDRDGGVFVEVPVIDRPNTSGPISITARSRRTGKEVTTTIDPIASVTGLWATSRTAGALVIAGSGTVVTGVVHSDSDVAVKGSGSSLTAGTEYATELTIGGNGHSIPNSRQVSPGGLPATVAIADYRPGGARAVAAGVSYHAIPASNCAGGVWTVAASNVPNGMVYVPCSVHITGSGGTVDAAIVAEGSVHVSGSDITLGRSQPGVPAIVSGATGADAVRVTGARNTVHGTIQVLAGSVDVHGSGSTLRCGIIADTIKIAGRDTKVLTDNTCIPWD